MAAFNSLIVKGGSDDELCVVVVVVVDELDAGDPERVSPRPLYGFNSNSKTEKKRRNT
jgi:hypothetical protein